MLDIFICHSARTYSETAYIFDWYHHTSIFETFKPPDIILVSNAHFSRSTQFWSTHIFSIQYSVSLRNMEISCWLLRKIQHFPLTLLKGYAVTLRQNVGFQSSNFRSLHHAFHHFLFNKNVKNNLHYHNHIRSSYAFWYYWISNHHIPCLNKSVILCLHLLNDKTELWLVWFPGKASTGQM